MRTSNIFVLAGTLMFFIFLLVHDFKLQAIYRDKSYLDPLRDFTPLDFRGFNAIDIVSSGVANAKIVQGPFKVMVRREDADYIHVSQKDGHLQINAASDNELNNSGYPDYEVYISCPSVTTLNFDNKYMQGGKIIRDSIAYEAWSRKNLLHGFTSDNLLINEDNGSYLVIDSCRIGSLKANVGLTKGSGPVIELSKGNRINTATMDIQYKSDLLLSCFIANLTYHLDDSSRIILSGEVSNLLNKR